MLQDDKGNEAISYDDTSEYGQGDFQNTVDLKLEAQDGYDVPSIVGWFARTEIKVVSLPLPTQVSSNATSYIITPSPGAEGTQQALTYAPFNGGSRKQPVI